MKVKMAVADMAKHQENNKSGGHFLQLFISLKVNDISHVLI